MKPRFRHINLIANDWKKLSEFYQEVFGCTPLPPTRSYSGKWLEEGTAVLGASLEGEHLRLPGTDESGPTLEIFSYSTNLDKPKAASNRLGYGHLGFEVENVEDTLTSLLKAGGKALGKIVRKETSGVGSLVFTYALDPEDNIIELLTWK